VGAPQPHLLMKPVLPRPPMFHRSPVTDSHNDFRDFTPFSFPSYALARIHRLRRPPELKHCDVRSDEWAYFIEALEQEAYRYADKSHLSTYGTYSQDDLPLLTEDVHQLLRYVPSLLATLSVVR
jgi:hypothetical protein